MSVIAIEDPSRHHTRMMPMKRLRDVHRSAASRGQKGALRSLTQTPKRERVHTSSPPAAAARLVSASSHPTPRSSSSSRLTLDRPYQQKQQQQQQQQQQRFPSSSSSTRNRNSRSFLQISSSAPLYASASIRHVISGLGIKIKSASSSSSAAAAAAADHFRYAPVQAPSAARGFRIPGPPKNSQVEAAPGGW
ncbi:MAG: hypothetical protein Q9193_003053 [Seirophora villosa]